MGLRLGEKIVKLFESVTFSDIYVISDSTLACGALVSESITQKLFFSVRNFESQQIFSKLGCQLLFTNSATNLADKLSKFCVSRNFMLEPEWFNGDWLCKERSDWPVKEYHFQQADVEVITNPKLKILSMQLENSQ